MLPLNFSLGMGALSLFAAGFSSAASFNSTPAQVIPPLESWPSLRIQLPEVRLHLKYYTSNSGKGGGTPLLLLHGVPQTALFWHAIAPLLAAEDYTVIVPDMRGFGASTLAPDGDYTAPKLRADIKGILDYLNITKTLVLAYDLGTKAVLDLAWDEPEVVPAFGVMEHYIDLPGSPLAQSVYQGELATDYNWQLRMFHTPEIAEWLLTGREKELLEWYFWHAAYQSNAISSEHFTIYERSLSKPGFLKALIQWYAADIHDVVYFKNKIEAKGRIETPILVLGGEASGGGTWEGVPGPTFVNWAELGSKTSNGTVPKAGHWLGDENPKWVADRVARFLEPYREGVAKIDLSSLDHVVTL